MPKRKIKDFSLISSLWKLWCWHCTKQEYGIDNWYEKSRFCWLFRISFWLTETWFLLS